MDRFEDGKAVRLRSYQGKYLVAKEDEGSVILSGNESDNAAIWKVERISSNTVRFKSFHGKYLIASPKKVNFRLIGRKVTQSLLWEKSSADWFPKIERSRLKFETAKKRCLRADDGVFPLKGTVTHKKPHRSPIHKVYLWEVEVLESEVPKPTTKRSRGPTSKAKVYTGIIKDAAITVGAVAGAFGAAAGAAGAINDMVAPATQEDDEGDQTAEDSDDDDE